ncbi:MAG TPA: ferritin-like domain-containing protein [Longimicrobium sp.]|jgi:hypothetical protein
MSNTIRPDERESSPIDRISQPAGRRTFLKWGGATVATAALLLAGCSDEDTQTIVDVTPTPATPPAPDPQNPSGAAAVTLNLTNDIGILNFAYALEQLEAAFYTAVVGNAAFATTFNAAERAVLTDLRDHEVIHREFFRAAIPAASRITDTLTPLFTSVNFGNRDSVLNTAMMFEDLGVGAYNGAGRFISDATYLTLAGKIVSVEARHAAAIRDLIAPKNGSFAPNDRDPAYTPQQVLALADPFIQNPVNATFPS